MSDAEQPAATRPQTTEPRSPDPQTPEPQSTKPQSTRPQPKRILLFSDGTGNSSAKLFKTNVWRMYQAADLGVPSPDASGDDRVQIGRYDNGVGTSSFRPFAILGGIFGFGLQRNVVSLYTFLCRNYRPHDEIYAFGFSRGAFTIRVLCSLIDRQGIVPHDADPEDIAGLCHDAYRRHRARVRPRMIPMRWIVPPVRLLLAFLTRIGRRLAKRPTYDPARNHRADLAFVGLWDTVAAYGGPIVELVRAWDDWILPILLTDTRLPGNVRRARQALALDDERDSFQPIPWDEQHDDHAAPEPPRIRQVWFAGMHSDVGGGYPDDSLSYVSFVWMLDEAKAAGLRVHDYYEQEMRRQADSFGPIHDSRSGLGGYYRYQPRNIGAYIRPPEPGTAVIRDPDQPADEGLALPVLVHESVFDRMRSGTDAYAPVTIPRDFRIVHNLRATESCLPEAVGRNLADPVPNAARAQGQKTVWDWVWGRRILYFTIVLLSLALASLPLWPERWPFSDTSAAGIGALVRLPLGWTTELLPSYLAPWPRAFTVRPQFTILLALAILACFAGGTLMERKLRFAQRTLWHDLMKDEIAAVEPGGFVRRLRTSKPYEWIVTALKWQLLPFVFGFMMLLLMGLFLVETLAQLRLGLFERSNAACTTIARPDATTNFRTDAPCNPMGFAVQAKQSYVIELRVQEPWADGGHQTGPEGIAAGSLLPLGIDRLGIGFRRVVGAGWLQPLIRIGQRAAAPHIEPVTLTRSSTEAGLYQGSFTASLSGPLALFVNDAVPPWPFPGDLFYRGWPTHGWIAPVNRGTACISIWQRTGDVTNPLVPRVTCNPPPPRASGPPG